MKVSHHDHDIETYIGSHSNKCSLQIKHPRGGASVRELKQRKNAEKAKFADKPTRKKYSNTWSKNRKNNKEDTNL